LNLPVGNNLISAVEIKQFFKKNPFFNGIKDSVIDAFILNVNVLKFNAGEIVLKKNQQNDTLYFLYSGIISICDEEKEIVALNSGRIFGERSLLTDGIILVEIISKSNTELLCVSADVFFNLIYSNNHVLKNLLTILFDRVNDTNQQIIEQLKNKEIELTQLVEKRTKQLEEKNNEITDSIVYAKSLLQNILPDINEIKKDLNAFIFYQPKDIVAGDFYWYHKKENEIYILAGDCTGHGVPGAITSVLCSQKLNEAIDKGHTNVKDILRCVDESIKRVFRLENHDGMECGLIKYNMDSKILQFCGVGRPMILIRNNEIQEYNAVRSSIGHNYMVEEDLIMHEISIKENDCFYLFSDGYQDQFGGEKNKKYTSKRLKEFFKQIALFTPDEQEANLVSEINYWMKRKENQIDDILVLGVKF
jgi:serine phosphatase RsbU (regulator of sigma subunit)